MITVQSTAEINKMTGSELVELYNKLIKELPDAERPNPVQKFATRETGVNRVKNLVTSLKRAGLVEGAPKVDKAPKTPKAPRDPNAPKAPRKHRGINLLPPGTPPTACLAGSRQATLLDMLNRPNGATMPELLKALSGGKRPWQETTVRSGFGWDMKQHGYGVRSIIKEGEPERFVLVVPTGFAVPPHRLNKTMAQAQEKASKASETAR